MEEVGVQAGAGNIMEDLLHDPDEPPLGRCSQPILSLEDLAMNAYLKYLENEVVGYIGLTQSPSQVLRNVAKKMMELLKKQINSAMSGLASSVLRERMIKVVLSGKFPSIEHCNIYVHKQNEPSTHDDPDSEHLFSNCHNVCCTGAFIQEAMIGVILSADVRELVFTSERVVSRRQHFPGYLEFNVPVVLTHLLGATHGKYSQLERLVFSENFVKEECCEESNRLKNIILFDQTTRQEKFAHQFGQGGIYESPDRRGLVLDMLVMFRDILPKDHGFHKLTELVLKNNIQCELYSKANFQFELLARIGFCCPRLRVLDIFGTDTWADCLVALFFRDAFHSLHRYLFFMENEDDESSAYHPHDVKRYCQFCLDQLHPNAVERPFTINPVIPLIDPIYDHVIKKYPRRSYCILRNCVRVSDLLKSPSSNVFELIRPVEEGESDPLLDLPSTSDSIKYRLRNNRAGEQRASNKRTLLQEGRFGFICKKFKSSEMGERKSTAPVQLIKKYTLPVADSSVVSPINEDHKRRSKRLRNKAVQPNGDTEQILVVKLKTPSEDEILNEDMQLSLPSTSDDKQVKTPRRKCELQSSQVVTRSRQRRLELHKGRNRRRRNQASDESQPRSSGSTSANVQQQTPIEEPAASTTTYEEWKRKICHCLGLDVCSTECESPNHWDFDQEWVEPDKIMYREISGWPHLNDCVKTLEILNIGGTNVLGEFIPFILLHAPKLKSLGQWINTMIYGLEILRQLDEFSDKTFPGLQEFSYSTDRNYFCQPYIGFVPESSEYKNVRKEMVRFSGRVARRISHSVRNHFQKKRQIRDDVALMVDCCPNIRKLNLVLHYKMAVIGGNETDVWQRFGALDHLVELDLVTMKFGNVKALIKEIGAKLETLTLEFDEEQGNGSEIVHIARYCPNVVNLRLLIGDKVLRAENILQFGSNFFRKLERLTVEGSVHLHGFAFLWGHCRQLKYMKLGLVVSNELTTMNVLIYDVFNLLFQINKMEHLEELHIKNLKIRSLHMGQFLLDNLTSLKKASNWLLDIYGEDVTMFKRHLKKYKARGLILDYKEW